MKKKELTFELAWEYLNFLSDKHGLPKKNIADGIGMNRVEFSKVYNKNINPDTEEPYKLPAKYIEKVIQFVKQIQFDFWIEEIKNNDS